MNSETQLSQPACGGSGAAACSHETLERLHAWMMAKKHGYLVEAGQWKKAGAAGMTARLEGKSAAMAEALRQLESMLARPNDSSAATAGDGTKNNG